MLKNLATTHHRLGDFTKAKINYEKCINSLQKLHQTEKNEEIAALLVNFAELEAMSDNMPKAVILCQAALKILVRTTGKDEFYAATLSNMATYSAAQKKFEEAEEPMKEAVEIFLEIFGRNNAIIREAVHNLANIFMGLKKVEELEKLQQDWNTETQNTLHREEELAMEIFIKQEPAKVTDFYRAQWGKKKYSACSPRSGWILQRESNDERRNPRIHGIHFHEKRATSLRTAAGV